MKEVCDFANSHLTFELAGENVARINIDARCEWKDDKTCQQFVLICPCQGEKMYVSQDLAQHPPYLFMGVFSDTQSHLIRTFADADVQRDSVEDHKGRFTAVRIDIQPFKNAVELIEDKEIVDATLRNLPLIARTELRSDANEVLAVMEYPITTMNVEPVKGIWQVDTGPILFPDLTRQTERLIERFVPAFTIYNRRDYAEFALRHRTSIRGDAASHHYSDIRKLRASSRFFCGRPL